MAIQTERSDLISGTSKSRTVYIPYTPNKKFREITGDEGEELTAWRIVTMYITITINILINIIVNDTYIN